MCPGIRLYPGTCVVPSGCTSKHHYSFHFLSERIHPESVSIGGIEMLGILYSTWHLDTELIFCPLMSTQSTLDNSLCLIAEQRFWILLLLKYL
jgi:hypothetical protein